MSVDIKIFHNCARIAELRVRVYIGMSEREIVTEVLETFKYNKLMMVRSGGKLTYIRISAMNSR